TFSRPTDLEPFASRIVDLPQADPISTMAPWPGPRWASAKSSRASGPVSQPGTELRTRAQVRIKTGPSSRSDRYDWVARCPRRLAELSASTNQNLSYVEP